MIDAMYNYRQGDIHSAEFSDEFNKLCIPFGLQTRGEMEIFHYILERATERAVP